MKIISGIIGYLFVASMISCVCLIVKHILDKYKCAPNYNPESTVNINNTNQPNDWKAIYKPKWLFTYNEKPIFHQLCDFAQKYNMICLAKVRLFDLIEPRNKCDKTARYKIQAKHVDFVLCTKNLVAKLIIELDDNSHKSRNREERDRFVDEVLTACGYKVIRINAFNKEELEPLMQGQAPNENN